MTEEQQKANLMKLLTHNMLSCHIKGVKNGYPFKIDPVKVVVPGL